MQAEKAATDGQFGALNIIALPVCVCVCAQGQMSLNKSRAQHHEQWHALLSQEPTSEKTSIHMFTNEWTKAC